MIKKLLSEKEHYTLSECAQEWDCSEQAILQLAKNGEIKLQANLKFTDGFLYVVKDSKGEWEELEQRTCVGFQTLSPIVCEQLLHSHDKKIPITTIVATQEDRDEFNLNYNDTVEIRLYRSMIVSGNPLDPLGGTKKDYQYITTKDVWISREEYERLRPENKDDHGNLDRNTDETIEANKEELVRINASSNRRRKLHTTYIEHMLKLGIKTHKEVWDFLKVLANTSKGKLQVELPGSGEMYLRRVRLDSENLILYSHEPFEYDKKENIPQGVHLINRKASLKAWNKIKKQVIES